MADSRAQEIITQVASLSGEFGVQVTYTRKRIPDGQTPNRNAFGTATNAEIDTLTANVIVEKLTLDDTPTLVGQKAKEELRLITAAGLFQRQDEITYAGKTYRVEQVEPVPFVGSDVVNFVKAFREVS